MQELFMPPNLALPLSLSPSLSQILSRALALAFAPSTLTHRDAYRRGKSCLQSMQQKQGDFSQP